jgi:hypothetical protein
LTVIFPKAAASNWLMSNEPSNADASNADASKADASNADASKPVVDEQHTCPEAQLEALEHAIWKFEVQSPGAVHVPEPVSEAQHVKPCAHVAAPREQVADPESTIGDADESFGVPESIVVSGPSSPLSGFGLEDDELHADASTLEIVRVAANPMVTNFIFMGRILLLREVGRWPLTASAWRRRPRLGPCSA